MSDTGPAAYAAAFTAAIDDSDHDAAEVALENIVSDIVDSMRLALKEAGVDSETIHEAAMTTLDYFGNHYG